MMNKHDKLENILDQHLGSSDSHSQAERGNVNEEQLQSFAKVKVIGVGGGGCNVINSMIEYGVMGVEFWVCNTDSQALQNSICENKLILGYNITKGLGAGANPEIGYYAAMESESELKEIIRDADMVFIASGMGGGTGTGAANVLAKVASELNILTVACVTKPFVFEGAIRMRNANDGIERLRRYVDSLIVISNERLLEVIGDVSFKDSFAEADKILLQAVQTITDLIAIPAQINLDFADIRTILEKKGIALIGVGHGAGEKRAEIAAKAAISCRLLDTSIVGAKNALVNITSANTTLKEVKTALDIIRNSANSDIDVIYGMAVNKLFKDEIVVTVIATGFDDQNLNCFDDDEDRITYTVDDDEGDEQDEKFNNFTENGEIKRTFSRNASRNERSKQNDQKQRDTTSYKQQQHAYESMRKNNFRHAEPRPQSEPKSQQSASAVKSKMQNIYESSAFTQQLNLQKKIITHSRKRSNEKLHNNTRRTQQRQMYEREAEKNVSASDGQSTSEVPSFFQQVRRRRNSH